MISNTQIKNTRVHTLYSDNGALWKKVPVADGKFVLVECKPEEALLNASTDLKMRYLIPPRIYAYKHNPKFSTSGHFYIPIIISETEKIEIGDWFYNIKSGFIAQLHESQNSVEGDYKILVLPEQFLPKHLQDIVDGKMKEGKVAVECVEDVVSGNYGDFLIKLDSQGHVTLHKVKEKMYTREDVRQLFTKAFFDIHGLDYTDNFPEWFEQNVQ